MLTQSVINQTHVQPCVLSRLLCKILQKGLFLGLATYKSSSLMLHSWSPLGHKNVTFNNCQSIC